MKIIQAILTNNDCFKQHKMITPKGIMLHSVGCAQPDAQVFVKRWNKPNVKKAVHGFVDAITGDVYQTLPFDMRGWHAGGSANNTHIGFEMCESAAIKYIGTSAKFEVLDLAKAQADARRTYESAVELFAELCGLYSLDPFGKNVIVSHKEGGTVGIASGHVDPEHYWTGLKLPYTMDGFRQDVKARMSSPDVYYRVQVGSFRQKANAERMVKDLEAKGFGGAFIIKVEK